MRQQNRPVVGATLVVFLALAPLVFARQVEVTSESPFRGGPNRTFRAMGTVPVGTLAEVLGQSGGWLQLKLPDGRTGYIFQTNARDLPGDAVSTVSTTTTLAAGEPAAPASTLAAPDVPLPAAPAAPMATPQSPDDLKNEVSSLRAKVDGLNEALARLHAGGLVDATGTSPRDGVVSLVLAALLVGFAFGFAVSWLVRRRSDQRQWNRLRF